ncbi:NUDIX domain-containing protein [Bacillus wiedmannii]|uniref:NUDIX domain-containing protein n=1 Tax=Bacillus cereus group TaxID=86661 RepID=UPI0029877F33|nr:NUDIX domain-containing protein [Bacillus toyonensis]
MKKTVSVVGAVIFNENNEILCALRSAIISFPNYWGFPGGKIDEGETSQEALVREDIVFFDEKVSALEEIKPRQNITININILDIESAKAIVESITKGRV